MRLRTLLLLSLTLSAALAAADAVPRETLTLADGRTVTGSFDQAGVVFTQDDGAEVVIYADQITARAAAGEKKAVAAAQPTKDKPMPTEKTEREKAIEAASKDGPGGHKMLTNAEQIEWIKKECLRLEAEVEPIRIDPNRNKVSHGKEPADPAWVEGTPEFTERQGKVDRAYAEIKRLQERAAVLSMVREISKP